MQALRIRFGPNLSWSEKRDILPFAVADAKQQQFFLGGLVKSKLEKSKVEKMSGFWGPYVSIDWSQGLGIEIFAKVSLTYVITNNACILEVHCLSVW